MTWASRCDGPVLCPGEEAAGSAGGVDQGHLPAPHDQKPGHGTRGTAPSIESIFGEVLADVLGVERVSVDSNFFDDLGADSMVMARFCARVRKRPDLPAVSIKDIYQHPTITSLATALGDTAPVAVEPPAPISVEVPKRAGTLQVARLWGAAAVDLPHVFLSGCPGHRPGL